MPFPGPAGPDAPPGGRSTSGRPGPARLEGGGLAAPGRPRPGPGGGGGPGLVGAGRPAAGRGRRAHPPARAGRTACRCSWPRARRSRPRTRRSRCTWASIRAPPRSGTNPPGAPSRAGPCCRRTWALTPASGGSASWRPRPSFPGGPGPFGCPRTPVRACPELLGDGGRLVVPPGGPAERLAAQLPGDFTEVEGGVGDLTLRRPARAKRAAGASRAPGGSPPRRPRSAAK